MASPELPPELPWNATDAATRWRVWLQVGLAKASETMCMEISMPRVAAIVLRCLRVFVAISVPSCYWLTGLYCLLSDFNWYETVIVGIIHLLIFLAAQRVAIAYYKPIIFFVCFVFLGLLTIVAAWIGWGGNIYRSFPLAVVGSVAWSIVSWECTACLSFIRVRKGRLHTGFPSITRADKLLVLTTPMIITTILGAIYAMTDPDARFLSERIANFFMLEQIGIACGLFLALPWFCLPYTLKLWAKEFREHNS